MSFVHNKRLRTTKGEVSSARRGLFHGAVQISHRQAQLLGALEAQREEQPERQEQLERPEQAERPEQPERQDQPERPEQPERQEAARPMEDPEDAGEEGDVDVGAGGETDREAQEPDLMGDAETASRSSSTSRIRLWIDDDWNGKGRRTKVNSVLGALCRYNYPGMVEVDGERQAAFDWRHWALKRETNLDGTPGRTL